MATLAAAPAATVGNQNQDSVELVRTGAVDVDTVDVELASGAAATRTQTPARRRRIYWGCAAAALLVAVVGVIAVYHVVEANKLAGATGGVTTVSVQDNVRCTATCHTSCRAHVHISHSHRCCLMPDSAEPPCRVQRPSAPAPQTPSSRALLT